MALSRRQIISGLGTVSLLGASGKAAHASAIGGRLEDGFTFVHITDLHIQPELGAKDGVAKAFAAIKALPAKPDFALVGGDLVMDANKVSIARADLVYDLWRSAADDLGLPLHYSIGNHDGYGLGLAATSSAAALKDPDFGKGMWKRRLSLTRTFDSFDHKGWRFITLDSLSFGPEGTWEGMLDDSQIKWLDDLLRATPANMPVVVLTHMPIMTIFGQYTSGTTAALPAQLIVKNGKTFQEMVQRHNVKAVFQGHTHVVEECGYLGTRYVTGGAICGDWWKGLRLGVHPEGFTVVTVSGADLTWRYVPYGWDARPYQLPHA